MKYYLAKNLKVIRERENHFLVSWHYKNEEKSILLNSEQLNLIQNLPFGNRTQFKNKAFVLAMEKLGIISTLPAYGKINFNRSSNSRSALSWFFFLAIIFITVILSCLNLIPSWYDFFWNNNLFLNFVSAWIIFFLVHLFYQSLVFSIYKIFRLDIHFDWNLYFPKVKETFARFLPEHYRLLIHSLPLIFLLTIISYVSLIDSEIFKQISLIIWLYFLKQIMTIGSREGSLIIKDISQTESLIGGISDFTNSLRRIGFVSSITVFFTYIIYLYKALAIYLPIAIFVIGVLLSSKLQINDSFFLLFVVLVEVWRLGISWYSLKQEFNN